MRKYEAKQGRRHLGATGVQGSERDLKIGYQVFNQVQVILQPILFLCMHTHNS